MPSFALPSPGPAGQPFQFATLPPNGATPAKLFLKNTTAAYVYDGTTLTKVTDSDYPALTVYGVAHLDGTIYVLDSKGTIYGCDLLTPLSWNPLNFIAATANGDNAVAIIRHLNYIVVFKERSTQFFYDAGNPAPGSPLSAMVNSTLEVGCASGMSIAFEDNIVIFMSASLQKGRSISIMGGLTPETISTPFVDRILNADDLAGVYAFTVKINGHIFYVLTLTTSKITLVYDFVTREWHEWTSVSLGTPQSATATMVSSSVCQVTTAAAHGLADGSLIQLGTEILPITVIDTMNFYCTPANSTSGSISFTPYNETYFPGAFYTRGANVDYLLSVATGDILEFTPTTYQDNGQPIHVRIRTKLEDWGTMSRKMMRKMEVVGDNVTTTLWLSYSDNDYQNFAVFRKLLLNNGREKLMATGSTSRRAFDIRHFDNTPLRLQALEVDFDLGAR